ncbi:MAG TPA: nucleotide exchange factor GrpE [Verrucomicrobiota bacterium]|nr:nucleotide exchange factor GrpE [Verrucomicrobiota bacterium]
MRNQTEPNNTNNKTGSAENAVPEARLGASGAETQTTEAAQQDNASSDSAELPTMPALSPEEAAELRAKAREAEENYDRYLRALAELENYRKRVAREREEAEKYRHEPLLRELLPVLDGLDMAFAVQATSSDRSFEALKAGVAMISQQLRNVLRQAGLEEIDALGKVFDPRLHEAVEHKETLDAEDGQVIQQLRKGYKYRDRLLRPATVVVAKKASEPKTT